MSKIQEIKNYSLKLHAEANTIDEHAENGFTEFACQQLTSCGVIDNYNVMYFEKRVRSRNMKVNGYNIDQQNENLDLIASYWTGSLSPIRIEDSEIIYLSKSLADFFRQSLKGLSNDLRKNSEEFSLAKLIGENKNKLLKVRLFILANGLTVLSKTVRSEKIDGIDVLVEILDIEKLYDLSTLGNINTDINLDFSKDFKHEIECIGISNNPEGMKTYLAIIPGDLLYKLYEVYGSKLLELNVRSFLQVAGKINKGIRTTLIDEPEMFFSYNNGIAATAESISFTKNDNGNKHISFIKGFQIVNGGQTTASIHRAKKVDEVDVGSISVPAKITIIEKDKLRKIVPNISRYANSQNAVKQSDFHSNNKYHKMIEEISKIIFIPGESGKWYFERMRGDYLSDKFRSDHDSSLKKKFKDLTPTSRKFSKEDIAKYVNAWEQKPFFVCTGAQKNFIHFMEGHAIDAVKNKRVNDDYFRELVGKAILYRTIEKIIKELKIPGFRAQIAPYVAALVSRNVGSKFNFSLVWQDQKISNELYEMLHHWTELIAKKIIESVPSGKNPTEWFKKIDCWKKMSEINVDAKGDVLPRELKGSRIKASVKQKQDIFSDEEIQNIKKCKKLSANDWVKLNEWGQKNGTLDARDLGYTLTLSNMARENWKNSPSPLIAEIGATIIELAQEENIL